MHIAFCFDAAFEQHFAAAAFSIILAHDGPVCGLTFHAITDRKSEPLVTFLEQLRARHGCQVELHVLNDVDQAPLGRVHPKHLRSGHLSKPAYFRLLIPRKLQYHTDRVIYLDCDLIVRRPLSVLWDTELEGNIVGAVPDVLEIQLAKRHGIEAYFNSGVLLMDLVAWRDEGISERAIDLLTNPETDAPNLDQCALNLVLRGRFCRLNKDWNVQFAPSRMKGNEQTEAISRSAILHYYTAQKPWQAWYPEHAGRPYWLALEASPWPTRHSEQAVTAQQHYQLARNCFESGRLEDAIRHYDLIARHYLKIGTH